VKADLRGVVEKLAETAPKSGDRLVVNLKTLFRRLIETWGDDLKMELSPAQFLVKPNGEIGKRDRYLTEDEIVLMFRAMPHMKGIDRVHAACLELLLEVGGRYDEGRELPWSEIDFEEGAWNLPAARSKNGLEHRMKLPASVLARLSAMRKASNSQWVFPSTKFPKQAFNCSSKPMANLLAKMREIGGDMPRWSAHDLRRTFNTHMKKAARMRIDPLLSKEAVERAINHVSGGMSDWYDADDYYHEKEAVYRLWSNKLEALREKAASLDKATGRLAA
jgi:integrase